MLRSLNDQMAWKTVAPLIPPKSIERYIYVLKKTITFKDIDGHDITEDFYFNIARVDMIELLVEKPEMEEKIQNMAAMMEKKEDVKEGDFGKAIMGIIKEFIFLSVGRREEGGRKFIKNQDIVEDFRYSGAYDSLFWELINDPIKANDFMMAIIPAGLLEEIQAQGGVEALQKQVAETQASGETIVELPDKDWAAKQPPDNPAFSDQTVELKESGTIEHVSDPRHTAVEGQMVGPTPFPGSLATAISAQEQSETTDQRPAWLREQRGPTNDELRLMGADELRLAFEMKSQGKFDNKQAG